MFEGRCEEIIQALIMEGLLPDSGTLFHQKYELNFIRDLEAR
jgi:hypothetical protein